MRRVPLLAPLLKMRIIIADNPPRTGRGGVIYSELTGNVIPGGRPLGVNPAHRPAVRPLISCTRHTPRRRLIAIHPPTCLLNPDDGDPAHATALVPRGVDCVL